MLDTIKNFLTDTGVFQLLSKSEDSFVLDEMWWQTAIMFLISFVLVYLAIVCILNYLVKKLERRLAKSDRG